MKGRDEQKGALFKAIVVIEQWIYLVWGIVGIACGIWGMCIKPGPLPARLAWLGWLYLPTLRVTAVMCLSMALLLVRRGWS